jgi:hypothetical protein
MSEKGQKADLTAPKSDFRFTPESGLDAAKMAMFRSDAQSLFNSDAPEDHRR